MIRKLSHRIIQYTVIFILCFITSNYGRKFQINFRLQPIDYQGQQAISPRYYQGNLTLPCQLEESSSSQRITYYWTHNHQPVQVDHRIVLRNGNLTLKWIQSSDAGSYQCFAVHNYGISASRIATLQLRHLTLPFNQSDKIAVQSLNNGQYARLTCLIPPLTNPLPNSIYWTGSNDNYITVQKHPQLYQSFDDGTLHFALVQPSDSSIYRCHTVFQLYDPMVHKYVTVVNHGQKQKLNVSSSLNPLISSTPVRVVTAPIDQEVPVGEKSVHFQCVVAGNSSTFQIQWYKSNDFLPIYRYRLSNNRYRLTIVDVRYEDRGQYYCQINDIHGHMIAERKALLTVIALPKWKYSIQDQVISLRQSSFVWHCQATGTNLQYRWYANGDIITNSTKYRSYPHNGTLIIHALQQSDSKVYTCMSINRFGNIVKSALAQFVYDSPPTFVLRPFAITKWILNRTNKLICQANGFPTPRLSFTKNDQQITSSKLTIIPSNGTLIVHRAELSDEGIYQCIATNQNGSIRIQTKVIIIPSFRLVLNYNSTIIRTGQQIRLTCNIANQQYGLNHSISWSYSNSRIYPSNRMTITANASSSTLAIHHSLFNDTGIYTCHVVSYVDDYGYISNMASATVHIIDIPYLPKNVRMDQVLSRSVTLRWHQQIDSNRPLTKIQIDYQSRSSGKWYQQIMSARHYVGPSDTITAILDNLIPYHYYIIKLTMVNTVGQRQINQEYQVTTLPDKPTLAPAQFYVSTTGADFQHLSISWLPLPRQLHYGPNINYRLYYNLYSTNLWRFKEAGDSGHYILKDVISHSKYNLYLVAWNSMGEGESKSPIATVTTNNPPPTSLPPFPKLYVIGLSVVRVRFENVWNSADIKISNRNKIYFWQDGAQFSKSTNVILNNLSDIILHSVQQGRIYKFQLCANGEGGDSQIKRIAIVNVTNPVPDRIQDVTFTKQNLSGVLLKWKAPLWLDFKASYQNIEYYRIEYSSPEDPTYPRISTVTKFPTYSIDELPEGLYTFTITARGRYGYGVPFDITYDMTYCQNPATPYGLTVKAIDGNNIHLLLQWKTDDQFQGVGFIMQYKVSNSQQEFQNITHNVVNDFRYLVPLRMLNQSKEAYQFRIIAVICSLMSIPSDIAIYKPIVQQPTPTQIFNNLWHIFLPCLTGGTAMITVLLVIYYIIHRRFSYNQSYDRKKSTVYPRESTVSARELITSSCRTRSVVSYNSKDKIYKTSIA